ncbi:MAG: AI-2E family transporter, partial [Xanthobacteraceae bacterium]
MTPRIYADTLKLALLVVAVALIPLLIWYLFNLILIVFGSVILAMLLRLGAQPFMRWLSIPEPLALLVSGLLVLFVIGGTGYLFGTRISDEFQDVLQRATSASAAIQSSLRGSDFGNFLLQHFSGDSISVTGVLSGVLRVSTNFLEAFILMIISGIYLAAQPRLYRK